jgi:GPH family glycoside/pentoside/hexuronide:cation symporter
MSNRTFLSLVAIIFTLAMGFDFVALFNYYITIFYLYGGDTEAASALLGINGTIWAVTGIVAVFPLNWLSRRLGKNRTLLVAILLMCAAQLSKIFAYNPELPYLVIIPTVLLSSGMLMFFTLGSSMLGDICDEDELQTGTRNEGSYCSVYWWFIATGKAFASFVTGALLLFTAFDERQKVLVDAVSGNVAAIKADAERLSGNDGNATIASENIAANMSSFVENSERLRGHLAQRLEGSSHHADHIGRLLERADAIRSEAQGLQNRSASLIAAPQTLAREADGLLEQMTQVRKQAPATLFRLRLFEIGVPLALSIVSIMLTLRYPLTEARCYEIKEALQARHATQAV